ncbi:MAG: FHA domain-containing protein [Marmoricola sp.]
MATSSAAARAPGRPAIEVAADLRLTLEREGAVPVHAHLHGTGSALELTVSDPGAFAGRGDAGALRGLAGALAGWGVRVQVVAQDRLLLELGATRTRWWQRRLTGSRHIRPASLRGAWTGLRNGGREAVLPDRRLAPPPTLWPPAPTFLRRHRDPVTTTHDPGRGGRPRLVVVDRVDGRGRHELALGEHSTIGSSEDCDLRLHGVAEIQAEVRHDEQDEFVLVHRGGALPSRVNGQPVREQVLRTGSRVDLGDWTLVFAREEYADHGRPYGGRVGGEFGRQLPQPPQPPPGRRT